MRIINDPTQLHAIEKLQMLAEQMILAPEGSIDNIHVCAVSGSKEGLFPTWNIQELERTLSTLGPVDFLTHRWTAYLDDFHGHLSLDIDMNAPGDKVIRLVRIGPVYCKAIEEKGEAESGLTITCPPKTFTTAKKLLGHVESTLIAEGLDEILERVKEAEQELYSNSEQVLFPASGVALMGPSTILTMIKGLKRYVHLEVAEPAKEDS